jgi:outer membrane lipoprotein-sorting protein
VILGIDKNKVEPRTVQVLYKDGNVVTYTLKRFVGNPELAESNFVFDKTKFPGVEINDMR